ncbi:MAG: integrase core domain-containing protein [Hyphomicrobiaceae bacterium]
MDFSRLTLGIGCSERLNDTLRQEGLKAEWSATVRQAQVVISIWLWSYNRVRRIKCPVCAHPRQRQFVSDGSRMQFFYSGQTMRIIGTATAVIRISVGRPSRQ